jgi:hypothetical protein
LLDGRVVMFGIDPHQHGRITAWLAGTEIARPTTARRSPDGPVTDLESTRDLAS